MTLDQHIETWQNCKRCEIGRSARNHVFFRGVVPCQVLFIGEGPGRDEDRQGKPFVGRSGSLLDEWITLVQVSWAITNVVACRPCNSRFAGNRPPTMMEIAECHGRLVEFIELAKPKAIVLLGKVSAEHAYTAKIPHVQLNHPAYVLRQGGVGTIADKRNRQKLADFLEGNRALFSN